MEGLEEEALVLDGLNDAIAGYSDCGRLIYDYQKMVVVFMKDGMTQDEAVEWIDYNVMGVQCNGKGFIVMYDKEMIDIEDNKMTREDLKTIKQIAYAVIKEQPVWISDLIKKNQDQNFSETFRHKLQEYQ